MGEKILSILDRENRPSVSNLLYFIGGLMEIVILVSMVSPFHISSNALDNINWSNNFTTSNILVKVSFLAVIIYIILHFFCMFIKDRFKAANNSKFRQVWICVHTIDDTIDLLTSITSFIFVSTVFIQQYKTGEILITGGVQFIYLLIAVRFLFLIIYRFYLKNRHIVENGIKKYPELD